MNTYFERDVHKAIDATCDVLRAGWCQHALARDANGRETCIDQGVSFCAQGAFIKANTNYKICNEIDLRCIIKTDGKSLSNINDIAENVEDVMFFLQSLKKDIPIK